MKRVVSTLGLDKQEWLKYRKQGIGGSDAGAICGLNPYRTAIQVYQDKVSDDIVEYDNESMRQGRDFENYVAKRFTEATGKKVRRANVMFYDEQYPFMLADVDRMVVGENAGLECKTASPYVAEKWEDDKIPLSYQLQCFHYMRVCQAEAWYIAVLIYGRGFKYYKLERDEEIIRGLIQIEQDFWDNHVMKRIMPEPDGSKLADSVITEYYPKTNGTIIPLSGFDEKIKRREEVVGLIEKLEMEKKQIEQELKLFLGEAEVAENNQYRVSWKPVITNRIDTALLKKEQPEIYKQYQKENKSRRFTIQAA
ncbi:YqaJ viral recombinase family protein [Faecalicatena contorta]|uniref:YqaJ viral recombinase family nuclease n=1 Tax=Faecalicatena contorta TaxID=39482 RepID=UPI001F187A67|nr:YqaJ viral recombinase family protein [Faecalicatena contorta]MCF2554385.1 YqaJ viral recombinase family protein [Faecalicatena contorta]